jgi:hypothetical protein
MQSSLSAQRSTPWTHLRPYGWAVAGGTVALLVTNSLALAVPWLLGRTVEALRGPDPAGQTPSLAVWMIAFAGAQAIARPKSGDIPARW